MNRTIMISDIHGCIHTFNKLLKLVSFNPAEDQLILLGDYVDRGPSSRDTVDRVIELVQDYGAVALRGNHDQRLVDLILNDSAALRSKFLQYGGAQTIQSYCERTGEQSEEILDQVIEKIRSDFQHHIDFLSGLPLYYEDAQHICVHAGLNPDAAHWKEQSDYYFMYIREPFIRASFHLGKKIVFGHTRTMEIHGSPDVWFAQDKIGIDGGCAYGMQLNALIFQDGTHTVISAQVDEGTKLSNR